MDENASNGYEERIWIADVGFRRMNRRIAPILCEKGGCVRRLQFLLSLALAFCTTVMTGCWSGDTEMAGPSAREILETMGDVYANCDSYSDSGTVESLFLLSEGENTEEIKFQTAFVRPNRFRFEFEMVDKPGSEYIVHRKDDEVKMWWGLTEKEEVVDSLGLAIAGATGVSSGAAFTIPSLLLGAEVGGNTLVNVSDEVRLEDEKVGDRNCFLIDAKYSGSPIKLWIDQENYCLLRVDTKSDFENFSVMETTRYQPQLNQPVPDEYLEFRAP